MILASDECQWTLLISQHWLGQWFGAVRQQAISWTSVGPDLCRHMSSPGLNELTLEVPKDFMRSCLPFWKMYFNQQWCNWKKNILKRNLKKILSNFVVNIVTADVLAPWGARASADTLMTKSSYICSTFDLTLLSLCCMQYHVKFEYVVVGPNCTLLSKADLYISLGVFQCYVCCWGALLREITHVEKTQPASIPSWTAVNITDRSRRYIYIYICIMYM